MQPTEVLQFDDTAALVDRAGTLKEQISTATEDLRRINLMLKEKATYKDGSKTGHLAGRHFTAKVQLKENVKWDQGILNDAREVMGDEEFFKIFKWEFSPLSAKLLNGALEFGQHAVLLESARIVTEGSPSVSFEKLEAY